MRENEGGVMLQDTVGTDVNAVILNDHQPKTKKQKTTRIS